MDDHFEGPAYEDLLAAAMYGHSLTEARALINDFVHELAEKIRADIIPELDEYGTREQQAEIDGRRGAADIIDPEKH